MIEKKNFHIYLKNELSHDLNKAKGISEVYEESLLGAFEPNNLNEKFEKLLNKELKRRK